MSEMNSESCYIYFLETLSKIVSVLNPQYSFLVSLRKILKILEHCQPFLRPHIVIYDPETSSLRVCLSATVPINSETSYNPRDGIVGQVFTLGQPIIVECMSKNEVFKNKIFIRTKDEMNKLSFLCMPIYAPLGDPFEMPTVLGTLNVDIPIDESDNLVEYCKFLEIVAGLIGRQVSYYQDEIIRKSRANLLVVEQNSSQFELFDQIVHVSKVMKNVLQFALRAALVRSNVLLHGQAGTGKELIASYIHHNSERRVMPLKKINCAILNAETIEQDFFGVQKNADQFIMQTKKGFLELANHGTIFLNGIDFLPKRLQETLMQVARDQELVRVGGSKPVSVNVRFICSSLKSPSEMLANNFISDDFLNVFLGIDIFIPPLSERKEDIIPLAEFFVHECAKYMDKNVHVISAEAVELILNYHWRNNVRELKYCIESAIYECQSGILSVYDLPPSFQSSVQSNTSVNFTEAVEYYEQKLISEALAKTKGNMIEAAHMLSASYRVINYKVKKYGISIKKYT